MSEIFDLVKRYPWLPSLEEYYSDIASKDPIDFINEIFSSEKFRNLNTRILNIFRAVFDNIEQMSEYENDEINIYMYIMLKIILYILDNKLISNRVANFYSKHTYSKLNEEDEYNLDYIYRDLNLEVIYKEQPVIYKKVIIKDQQESKQTNFIIHYIDYLKLASRLKDNNRKLVNNSLSNGYVYIESQILNRLIQEYVRSRFLTQKNVDQIKKNELREELFKNQEFKNLYEKIVEIWERKKGEFEYSFEIDFEKSKNVSENFPPCLQEMLSKVKEGQNLSHIDRLFLVWCLNALKYPENEIVSVFSSLPDFDRDKTTYQVKYAMKKGYTPYSCQSLKSYNLCMAKRYKDEICLEGYYSRNQDKQVNISHPLSYVRIKQYRTSKKLKNSTNQLKNKNERS